MVALQRYSEPYNATGGLAAAGIINQLGRPNIEPLEVLVRESLQNSWDAKRDNVSEVQVKIGRRELDSHSIASIKRSILTDPPSSLGLSDHLKSGMRTLYFADFGTRGLAGPTRADRAGGPRNFIDFVRNVGQPPDKALGGGSFGYGKAAFFIASQTGTVIIDTLCLTARGGYERRLIASALGPSFEKGGKPYTGRHWWGIMKDGAPEPLTGNPAGALADRLGLPPRRGELGLGTTVMIVAPKFEIFDADEVDCTMNFIAESVVWNFWPRMINTRGATKRTLSVEIENNGAAVKIPNPRTDQRLRGFVEAMDRMREEPGEDDEFTLDREVKCLRPVRSLGRVVVQKGAVAAVTLPDRPVPQGARLTKDSVHHVALMRTPEIVVRYLPGPLSVSHRFGYSGVFKCSLDVDDVFKSSEPPTHDDWAFRSVSNSHHRTFVKIALERLSGVCRSAAGYETRITQSSSGAAVPLGEFADALAALMPGASGLGARRPAIVPRNPKQGKGRKRAKGRASDDSAESVWVDGDNAGSATEAPSGSTSSTSSASTRRTPQARSGGDPWLDLTPSNEPVVVYPFELRGFGNVVELSAQIEVMTNDGAQVEVDAPAGYVRPRVLRWLGPDDQVVSGEVVVIQPKATDGRWTVEVELRDEMMRVDVKPKAL